MFISLVYIFIFFPTLPLERKKCPTVVENMSGLVEEGEIYLWLSLDLSGGNRRGGGRWAWIILGEWSENFLIGPP